MSDSIRDKVVRGAFWNAAERSCISLLLFISNIVLARLLSPDDFGYVGVLTVIISVSDVIVDCGLSTALIQKTHTSQIDYSTIFFWDSALSIFFYILFFLGSSFISSFFEQESLSPLMKVLGLTLIFNSLTIVQRTYLTKFMKFKKLARINATSTLIGAVLGVICAFVGFGVWSLIIKLLSRAVVCCALFWITSEWIPRLKCSMYSLRSLFRFSGFVFLTTLSENLYTNIISVVIGKNFSSTILGYFTQARKLEDVPRQTIASVVNNVTFSAFSSLQNNMNKLEKGVKDSFRLISYISFSLTIFLIVVAKPIIVLLFSEKWMGAIPYFQIICLYGLLMSIIELNMSVMKAVGDSKLLFYTGISSRMIGITLIIIGVVGGGMRGMLFCFVSSQIVSFIIVSYYVGAIINFGFWIQVKEMMPNLIVSIIAGFLSFLVLFLLHTGDMILLIVQFSIYFITLFTISSLLNLKSFALLLSVSRKYILYEKR